MIIALCLWGAWYELARMRLGRSLRRLERVSAELFANAENPRARIRARSELTDVEALIERFGWSADLHMIAAVNYRTLGQLSAAARHYEAALAVDYRPEILMNLAIVHFESGRNENAVSLFAEAVEYDPSYLSIVPPSLVKTVNDAARERSKMPSSQ